MAEYRDLAYLLEKTAPEELSRLRAAHPSALDLFAAARRYGPGEAAPAQDGAAARDFCITGLAVAERNAEALFKRLRGKLNGARALRVFGSLVAMGSAAGVAASALNLLSVDQQMANLVLSGVAFAGAAAAALSDDVNRGAARGADAASLFERVANVRGALERAKAKFAMAEAVPGKDDYFDVLKDLNEAAYELGRLKTFQAIA